MGFFLRAVRSAGYILRRATELLLALMQPLSFLRCLSVLPPVVRTALGRLTVAATFLLCLASAAFSLPGEENERPLHVGNIFIDQRNVFDDSSSTLPHVVGSVANSVHILTDEEVIRRELLFREGDAYDAHLVEESGQNLRNLGIMGDVVIDADTLDDNSVDITIRTHDRWTLRPGVAMRQEGPRGGFSVSVRDDNFLGNAQKLRLGYTYLSGPGNPHGGEVAFTEPRLWGSRWNTTLQYGVSQEYRVAALNVESPFYSDRTPLAARAFVAHTRVHLLQYRDDLAMQVGYIDQENELAWVASRSQAGLSLLTSLAYVRMRSRPVGYPLTPFGNVDLVIGSVSVLQRNHIPALSADVAGRIEDISVGYQAGMALGRNLHFTTAGTEDYFIKVFGQSNVMIGGKFFASYQALATTYIERRVVNETIISGIALHHWQLSPNQHFIGRVGAIIQSRCDPTTLLVLGASNGLHGYGYYEFIGQRMMLINLEHRMLSLARIWFLQLSGAIFFDSGAMWNEEQDLRKQRFHSSAGVGLGMNVGGGIVRVDIAYNLEKQKVALRFSANQVFRVFAPLEFTPPTPVEPLR